METFQFPIQKRNWTPLLQTAAAGSHWWGRVEHTYRRLHSGASTSSKSSFTVCWEQLYLINCYFHAMLSCPIPRHLLFWSLTVHSECGHKPLFMLQRSPPSPKRGYAQHVIWKYLRQHFYELVMSCAIPLREYHQYITVWLTLDCNSDVGHSKCFLTLQSNSLEATGNTAPQKSQKDKVCTCYKNREVEHLCKMPLTGIHQTTAM